MKKWLERIPRTVLVGYISYKVIEYVVIFIAGFVVTWRALAQ